MALWSNTDAQASKPKFLTKQVVVDATDAAVVVLGSDSINIKGHSYETGDAVIYTTSGTPITPLVNGTVYYVIRVDSDTIQLAANANDAAAGTEIVLTVLGDSTDDTIELERSDVVFVSAEEAQTPDNKAKGLTHAGWWTYSTYVDANTNTRHKAECIVAMGTGNVVSGDANDDAIVVDPTITIDTQPLPQTVTDPDPATFVVAASVDNGATPTYQWQNDGGTATWVNEVGATGTSFTVDPSTGLDGYSYRVIVSSQGAASVTSNEVLLTVNP